MKQFANLFIAALLFPMGAAAQSLLVSPVTEHYQLMALGMSANHRYITGLNAASYCGFIWDTETGRVVENSNIYLNCDFRSVTNDGCAYGILGADDMVTTQAAWFDMEGKEHFLETEYASQCFGVTPDGSVAVGCLIDTLMWFPTACIWRDGKRELLPVPTSEECGFVHDGANAQFISGDGAIIAGYLQDEQSSRPAIIWRRQEDGSYAYDLVCKKYWSNNNTKQYRAFQCLGISDNGEWLALSVKPRELNGIPQVERVARFNLKTQQLQVSTKPYDKASGTDYSYPSGIADNGTLIGTIVYEDSYRCGLIWQSGTNCAEAIASRYPKVQSFADYDIFMHSGIAISPDARYLCGYGLPITIEDGEVDYHYESYLFDAVAYSTGIQQHVTSAPSAPTLRFDPSGRMHNGSRGLFIQNGKVQIIK